jgi:hypothetical protein
MNKPNAISRRFTKESGIALGPILFVLAMLAVLAVTMSQGIGEFGQAGITDRIAADIATQANLIRSKINECYSEYGTSCAGGGSGSVMSGSCSNYDGYPSSVDGNNNLLPTDVKSLSCQGDNAGQQNLWTGARPTQLPQPTAGFSDWVYVNTNLVGVGGSASGGRCVYIQPGVVGGIVGNGNNNSTSAALVAGLTKAASKFTHNTVNDGSSEVNYNPASSSQKFVLWITLPTGSADSNCTPTP